MGEVHRLKDPSLLLKIAADEHPSLKILEALEIAHAIHRLRPFPGGGSGEIVSRPKCYAFDTGFVTFERGWSRIRDDDRSTLR